NKTRNANITLRNEGNVNLTSIAARSSDNSVKYGSHHINFTYDYSRWIEPGQAGSINILFDINTSKTDNAAGLYTGWIYLEANESRPYRAFNVSIKLNLSERLRVVVASVTSPRGEDYINNYTIARNVTVKVKLYYLNGTEIVNASGSNRMGIGNFSIFLDESNTTYRRPTSGYLTITKGRSTLYYSDGYYINATIPKNTSGGRFYVNTSVTYKAKGLDYTGSGKYDSLAVRRPGLHVTFSRTSLSMNEGKTSNTLLNVSLRNYGLTRATGRVGLDGSDDNDCAYLTITAYDKYDDGANTKGPEFSAVTINGNNTERTWYRWRFTAANLTTGVTCTRKFNSTNPLLNNRSIDVTISNVNTGGSSDDSSSNSDDTGSSGDDTTAYNYSLRITAYPKVVQALPGEVVNASIAVKNVGNISTSVKTAVSIDDDITATTFPESQSIAQGITKNFTVQFNVSEDAALGNHSSKFKVYVALKTDRYNIQSFTFKVLSTPERELEINNSYLNKSLEFEKLLEDFMKVKDSGFFSIEDKNFTIVYSMVNDTKLALENAKAAIASGDYATAESLLKDVTANIGRIKDKMSTLNAARMAAESQAWGSLWVWIIIGIVIAGAIGLFIYMLLPPPGYDKKYGFTPAVGGTIMDKIIGLLKHEKISKLKSKVSDAANKAKSIKGKKPAAQKEAPSKEGPGKYQEGYEKHKHSGYKYENKKRRQ
ncbi:MAG: hypothetical protein DRO99_01780, partial [Candidatus Aenigmatarchaeota archaeon]